MSVDSRKVKEELGHDKGLCRVCGDTAGGYNFGVISCESCKAFFRRHITKQQQDMTCPFTGNCGISAASRRFCQACRLAKCITVGMTKDVIGTEKIKRGKRPKPVEVPEPPDSSLNEQEVYQPSGSNTEEDVIISKTYLNKLIRKARKTQTSCECRCQCGFYPPDTRLVAIADPIETSHSMSSPMSFGAFSPHPPPPVPDYRVSTSSQSLTPTVFQSPTSPYTSLAPISSALTFPLSQFPEQPTSSWPDSREERLPAYVFKMSQFEQHLMKELMRASDLLNEPLPSMFVMQTMLNIGITEACRISEMAARRLVTMTRELSYFSMLHIEDKKTLLKASTFELLILRGAYAYDSKTGKWEHVVNQFKFQSDTLGISINILSNFPHYEEHKRFLECFEERIRKNERVMHILMAIVLFRSEHSELVDPTTIRQIQAIYTQLLARIVELEFGAKEKSAIVSQLNTQLNVLGDLGKGIMQIYGSLNLILDPLIKELLLAK